MTQRNPMNARYNENKPAGKTRKSASAAKPKAKAASSVHVQSAVKTPQQKKAIRKARAKEERAKQRELDRRFYNPPTKRYKMLRRLWWVVLIAAVVCTVGSFLLRSVQPEWLSFVSLGLAYACIIAAFYIDFSPIKKERRRYQAQMESKVLKEMKEAEKAAKQEAKQKYDEAKETEAKKAAEKAEKPKRGLFGRKKAVEAEAPADDSAKDAK